MLNTYYVNVDCEYLVYQKMHLFSPDFLNKKDIELNTFVQFPGEVIITNAIHFGVKNQDLKVRIKGHFLC